MKPVHSTENFAIFDDFLPQDAFATLQKYMETETFSYVHAKVRRRIFGLLDGNPLVGPSVFSAHDELPSGAVTHPSGNSTDLVIEAVENALQDLAPWTGQRGESWRFFTCTPYIYPLGSGLSWHDDAQGRSASYVLYLHPEWHANWGGELLIEPPTPSHPAAEPVDAAATGRRRSGHGVGHFVAARPNRLVLIQAGVPHTVKKVDPSAGDHARMSVAGFFH
jgi:2OG-Fe(II) oxygenase superfamily